MTALAIGASVTAIVRDGGTVAIATNGGLGTITRTAVGGTTATINFGPEPTRRIFGPYSEGASLTITNLSCNAFDYDPQTTDAASDFLGAFAWLGLPDPASYAGYRARVTDRGYYALSDGVNWKGTTDGVKLKGLVSFDTKRNLALREWFRALSARATTPAVLFGIGDSISEGKGATSYLTRWNARLPLLLSADYPTTGVTRPASFPQYLEVQMTTNTGDFPVATPGGFGADTPNKGLGARSINLSGAQTATLTVSGATSVDLFYYRATGTRTIGVKVDAGSVTNVDGGNESVITDGFSTRITMPDTGSHTITISAVAGAVGIDGFYVYNGDEAKGIKCMLGGRASAAADMFSVTTATFLGQQVNALQPNCVLIELGANDFQNTGPVTAAVFSARIASIIANIRANVTRPPSIVLLPVWTWTPGTTPVETGGWDAFVAAMNAIAAADDDICICDFQQKMTLATANDATLARGLISGDSIHPSDAGHWMMAESLRRFLAP